MTKHRDLCEREARPESEEDGMLEVEVQLLYFEDRERSTSQGMPMAFETGRDKVEAFPLEPEEMWHCQYFDFGFLTLISDI